MYESLDRLSEHDVRRHRELKLPELEREAVTLLTLGVSYSELKSMSSTTFEQYTDFVEGGGRLVVSLVPIIRHIYEQKAPEDVAEPDESSKDDDDETDREDEVYLNAMLRWGFGVGVKRTRETLSALRRDQDLAEAESAVLPTVLPWHSKAFFPVSNNTWQVLYEVEENPVVIRKAMGAGELVISSDTYLLSNEAMLRNLSGGWISWVSGNRPLVLFDEAHLGILEAEGIALLIRKYRMHGFFAGVIVVLLFILWRNMARFLVLSPEKYKEGQADALVAQAGGLEQLLGRTIPRKKLLETCVHSWKQAKYKLATPRVQKRFDAIESEVNKNLSKDADIVTMYQDIVKRIHER